MRGAGTGLVLGGPSCAPPHAPFVALGELAAPLQLHVDSPWRSAHRRHAPPLACSLAGASGEPQRFGALKRLRGRCRRGASALGRRIRRLGALLPLAAILLQVLLGPATLLASPGADLLERPATAVSARAPEHHPLARPSAAPVNPLTWRVSARGASPQAAPPQAQVRVAASPATAPRGEAGGASGWRARMPSRPRPFAAFNKPAEIPKPALFKRPDLFKLRARIKPKPKPTLGEQIGKDVSQIADDVANTVREAQGHVTGVEKDTIVLLLTTALVTPLMGYVGLSPVLGFLFAGMVLGPGCLGLVSDVATTTKLAELGVVFFLFEMGLELEYERLKSVGRDAFRLGSLQFALTSGLIAAIGSTLFNISPAAAIVIGGGLALSSSAFAIQLLSEKGELASRFGRASFGILLFQDIAVVPLLVVTPLLGGSGAQLGAALRLAAFKSVSALGVIIITGRLLLQRVFQVVASAKDQTAFLAITLLTVLSMSAFTQALGLSDTLGAFLAGVLLAETRYRYQIEADVAPFRGLLLGLFFITTGFSIDLPLALASAPAVLALALGLHAIKTTLTTATCLANGLKFPAALRSGLLLSQGGEFAFVIFALAQTHAILPPTQVKLLLTVVVVSMFLTPFLNEAGSAIASRIEKERGSLMLPREEAESGDYVLVCGFGRVGQAVCDLLTAKLVRYKAFDMDPYRVAEARDKGLPVFYGDARRPDVLQAFITEEKRSILSVVVALATERDCTRTVRALRRQYPSQAELPIFVRANDEKHRRKLAASGATALETGPEESALMLGGALLGALGLPDKEVRSLVDDRRADVYTERMKLIGELVQIKQLLGKKPKPEVEEVEEVEVEATAEEGAAHAVDAPADHVESPEMAVQEIETPPADLGGSADLAPGAA